VCCLQSGQPQCICPQEDGQLASLPTSDSSLAPNPLANVYKLGERKWRRNVKHSEANAYNGWFTAVKRRWRRGASVQDGNAEV
jgi:hypothetical protein